MKIGVLAVQGDVIEHRAILRRLGVADVEVRLPGDLAGVDGLILPGGESTTIGKLMVNDLVTDAMMDAHDIAIRREPTDLAAMLSDIVAANRGLAERKKQTIDLHSPPFHLTNCDPDRLREAVDNLLSNAIKYSPLGGHIELSMTAEDGSTIISVKDRGPGLSEDDLSRLFGRFQRLSAKPTAGEGSTGLGLSIVKRIVELHGGTVSAESAGAGQGATFTMRLPTAAGD